MPTKTKAVQKPRPVDPIAALEQRFAYRIQMYLANSRNIDLEFTLPGLRGWMLCQTWPQPPASATLECLAVLSWTAVCRMERQPADEDDIRGELAHQFDYLTGHQSRKPAALDALMSARGRRAAYASLCEAATPGSSSRVLLGLPRFNVAEKLP